MEKEEISYQYMIFYLSLDMVLIEYIFYVRVL